MVAMAEEAAAKDNNIGRDYWMGGVKAADGTWRWRSGDPMNYTNWCEGCPDTAADLSQLLKNGYPGTLDTFYWARETITGNGGGGGGANASGSALNGVICEMNLRGKVHWGLPRLSRQALCKLRGIVSRLRICAHSPVRKRNQI